MDKAIEVRFESFSRELSALLEKHKAELSNYMYGDTHGIYEDGIEVSFKLEKKPGAQWARWSDPKPLDEEL